MNVQSHIKMDGKISRRAKPSVALGYEVLMLLDYLH